MKQLLTFFLLLSFGFAYAQDNEDNIDRDFYRTHKIKSVKIYESRRKNGKPCKREKIGDIKFYDTTGLITESFFYSDYFRNGYHEQYKYDSTGKIREHIGFIMKDEPVSTYYAYKYDEQNRLIEKTKSREKWIYTYDANGNMVSSKWLVFGDEHPNTFLLDSFQYNLKRQQVKMTRYRNGDALYFYKTFEYDNDGNKIVEMRYENGGLTDIWTYHYDSAGHVISRTYSDAIMKEPEEYFLAYEYDQNGLIISSIVNRHYRRYVYEYYQ